MPHAEGGSTARPAGDPGGRSGARPLGGAGGRRPPPRLAGSPAPGPREAAGPPSPCPRIGQRGAGRGGAGTRLFKAPRRPPVPAGRTGDGGGCVSGGPGGGRARPGRVRSPSRCGAVAQGRACRVGGVLAGSGLARCPAVGSTCPAPSLGPPGSPGQRQRRGCSSEGSYRCPPSPRVFSPREPPPRP